MVRLASIFLVGIFTICTWCAIFKWDILLPAAILSLTLATVMVGNLFNSKSGLIYALTTAICLIAFYFLSTNKIVVTDTQWQTESISILDPIEIGIFLLFTSGLSWVSNHQTTLLLRRVQKSEHQLKIEKNNLEIKVLERTKEIERIQIEKISEFQNFVEFGKLSAGLIHDLMSPLNAICIEIETNNLEIKNIEKPIQHVNPLTQKETIKNSMLNLIKSGQKIQTLISAARKQIRLNLKNENFMVKDVINDIVLLNEHRIKKANICFKINIPGKFNLLAPQSIFTHICSNIISNAIDACDEKFKKNYLSHYKPLIKISAFLNKNDLQIHVKDNGIGLANNNENEIPEIYLSTKGDSGSGFGLATAKYMIEKYFSGKIIIKSNSKSINYKANKKNKFKINDVRTEFSLIIPLPSIPPLQ